VNVTFETPYLAKGRIEIPVAKYLPAYKENLKKLRQDVVVPGFRPGHVPIEYVRGRYGKETLEKILTREFFAQLEGLLGEERLIGIPLYMREPEEVKVEPPYGDYAYAFEAIVRPTEPPKLEGSLPPSYQYEAASGDMELFRRYIRMYLGQKEPIEHLPSELPTDKEVHVNLILSLPSGKSVAIGWVSFMAPFPYGYIEGRKVGDEVDLPPSHLAPYTEVIRAIAPDFSPLTIDKATLRIHSASLITPVSEEALDQTLSSEEQGEKAWNDLFNRTLNLLLNELNTRTYQNGILHAVGIEIPSRLLELNYLFYLEGRDPSEGHSPLSYEKYARLFSWRVFMESHKGHIPDLEVPDEVIEADVWNKFKADLEATEKGRELLAQFSDTEAIKPIFMQTLSDQYKEDLRSSMQYERFENWLVATYGPRPEKALPLQTILLAGL